MLFYLRHPVHGKKIANLEAEAAYDEENGWTRYELDNPAPPVAAVAESINKDDKEAAINSMPLRRRGRPPINRGL